jgi:hypothetical protein
VPALPTFGADVLGLQHSADLAKGQLGQRDEAVPTPRAERAVSRGAARSFAAGHVLASAAAGSQGAAGAGRRGQVGAEHSPLPQLGKIGETDARQCVEEVGLRGADAARILRARAESAAGCHTAIVWVVPPLADRNARKLRRRPRCSRAVAAPGPAPPGPHGHRHRPGTPLRRVTTPHQTADAESLSPAPQPRPGDLPSAAVTTSRVPVVA